MRSTCAHDRHRGGTWWREGIFRAPREYEGLRIRPNTAEYGRRRSKTVDAAEYGRNAAEYVSSRAAVGIRESVFSFWGRVPGPPARICSVRGEPTAQQGGPSPRTQRVYGGEHVLSRASRKIEVCGGLSCSSSGATPASRTCSRLRGRDRSSATVAAATVEVDGRMVRCLTHCSS